MKIAQITSVYISVPPKTHGGTERIVYNLCQQLSRRGHQVELFASGDSKVDCTLQSVLPIACQDDPLSTFYLEKEFETRHTYDLYRQAERFDLIHAHSPTLAPYFSAVYQNPYIGHLWLYRKGTARILSNTLSAMPSGMCKPGAKKNVRGRIDPGGL